VEVSWLDWWIWGVPEPWEINVAGGSGEVSMSLSFLFIGEVPSSFVFLGAGEVPVSLTLAGGWVEVPSSLLVLLCFMGEVYISIPFKIGKGDVPNSLAVLANGEVVISNIILLGIGEVSISTTYGLIILFFFKCVPTA
jgi:hypothetical protein